MSLSIFHNEHTVRTFDTVSLPVVDAAPTVHQVFELIPTKDDHGSSGRRRLTGGPLLLVYQRPQSLELPGLFADS
jgi:hypothetical protein